jgi:hypothetical protein
VSLIARGAAEIKQVAGETAQSSISRLAISLSESSERETQRHLGSLAHTGHP